MQTWKPVVAGTLTIITGAFTAWYRTAELIRAGSMPLGIAVGLIAIAGGVFAIWRKAWSLALAGAACAIAPAHPWGKLIWTPVLGILAVALVVLSKSEFKRRAQDGS
jgi:hypothetical protein